MSEHEPKPDMAQVAMELAEIIANGAEPSSSVVSNTLVDAASDITALQEENERLKRQPHYIYIGKDGKSVKARDLEDRAEAAEARANAAEQRLTAVEHSVRVGADVDHQRDFLAMEARRYASHYPEASDGRNTFIMFAEMIEDRAALKEAGE